MVYNRFLERAHRVGRGAMHMVSTTRVMSTGLPMRLQLEMTLFCTSAIFSGSTSRPRLPRDRMMPSAALAMLLKLNSACRVSHLAMICAAPQSPP